MDIGSLIDIGIPAVVIFMMMLVGLRLRVDDFRRVLERPGLVAAALLVQPLLLPALAGGTGWLVGTETLVTIALVLIAACPAGVLSNVYTAVAGGNVALSVTLTAAGTLLSVATVPLVTSVGFALIPGHVHAGVAVPLSRTVADLVLTILVPIGAGMTARRAVIQKPRLERGLQAAGALGTLALVGALLMTQWDVVTGDLVHLSVAMVIFSAVAALAGIGVGRVMPTAQGDRVALAFELPGRNLGVVAVVGVSSLGHPEIAGLATAAFVVQVPALLVVSLGVRRLGKR